jgi:hypothetical protein
LNQIDVFDPTSLVSYLRTDSFVASVERRTLRLLRGKPVGIPAAPVQPDHAVSRFAFWVEWLFSMAVRARNRRNLRKIALEIWNTYALADGFVPEPCLSRSEMEAGALQTESGFVATHLEEAAHAARFVFGLAERLHRSRLPTLRKLEQPFIFDATMPPLRLPRRFVVLPRSNAPLPPEAFQENAFPCTLELLDLYLHYKNAFFNWILPRELADLGIRPPSVAGFLRSCLSYGHNRFLFVPGFADRGVSQHAVRLAQLRHAVEWAARGELPPPLPQQEIDELTIAPPPILEYYRDLYEPLRRESRQIEDSVLAVSGAVVCA